MRIILFGIWTWDFISDILFVFRMYDKSYYIECILSGIFVIIPWILNIIQLIKIENMWTNDNSIKYVISRWLLKNNKKLFLLTIICGSAFAPVELCNSRAFGMYFAFVYCVLCAFCDLEELVVPTCYNFTSHLVSKISNFSAKLNNKFS